MEAIKEFERSLRSTGLQTLLGSILVGWGLISYLAGGYIIIAILGIFVIAVGLVKKNLKIVKIHPEYLQVQLTLFASKNVVKYDQITSFHIIGTNIKIHYKTKNDQPQVIKIPITVLEKDDLLEFDKVLKEKTKLRGANTLNTTSTKLINPLMIIWLIIQVLILLLIMNYNTSENITFFSMMLPFVILNYIGAIIILSGKPKTGSILFMIGSLIFVPIGLIGAIGARQLLNKIKEDKFIETL